MTLALAKAGDLKEVYSILHQHEKIFSFVRQDKIKKHIQNKTCIFDSGIVITFTKYKVRRKQLANGTFSPGAGDYWIHQIANKNLGSGKAEVVLRKFLDSCGKNMVFLSVAKTNDRAIAFYKKIGFLFDGETSYNVRGKKIEAHVCVWSHEFRDYVMEYSA